MKQTHTPGPWIIQSCPDNPFHYYVVDSPTESYLIAGPFLKGNKMKPDPRDEQRQADARLISAAPDLLGALIEVRARMQGFNLTADAERALLRVDAAIKKATGL